MRVGVGLPSTIPGTDPRVLVRWAETADAGPYSSLGVLDRLVYDNFESMTALAACAAVTSRISLATTIVIAPLRSPLLLAKQAATIHALSGGRLTLGVGLGAREDDYAASDVDYASRGKRLTDSLMDIRSFWEREDVGPSGVEARPKLLVGGAGGPALVRMARYADGYVHGGGPPRAFARAAVEACAAWADLGRPGRPELWGQAYFALDGAAEEGREYLKGYYRFTGAFAERIATGLLTTAGEVAELLVGYADAGCDELILFPVVACITQLEALTAVLAD